MGRLLEIRVTAGYRCPEDVNRMIDMMWANIGRLPAHEKCAIAADWRAVRVMSPETAERVREMLARSNPRVSRSTILITPEDALINLQLYRLVKEADNANRKHFTSAAALESWLSEVLSPEETERLHAFLNAS